jgi:predicted adenine nucleotide alpha hydrolase (AANH) superfamily ATPase
MNNFMNWYYNPDYFNQQTYYAQQAQIQMYEQKQQVEVIKARKAFNDLMEAVQKMDLAHQHETGILCLADFARRNGW